MIIKELNQIEEFKSLLQSRIEKERHLDLFSKIADMMMNRLCLIVNNNFFRITECEFYFNDSNEDSHKDPYTHCREEQKEFGKWYFNDMGIDLTFGNGKDIYAGILIRGIKNLKTGAFTNGPSRVLREIFRNFGMAFESSQSIFFTEAQARQKEKYEPVATNRIGLTKKMEDQKGYINRPYRFVIELDKEHKFQGKLSLIRQLLINDVIKPEDIKGILGYNLKNYK